MQKGPSQTANGFEWDESGATIELQIREIGRRVA